MSTTDEYAHQRRRGLTSAVVPTIFAACLLLLLLAQGVAFGQAASRFVGNWVEDQSKRTIAAERSLTFRRAADGSIEELRGSYARPLVQPVRFGAPPYAVDGSRNTLVWRQLSPSQFERTISQNGRPINTRRILISADGKTLTEVTENAESRGKGATVTIVFRRQSGDAQGLVGVWKPESRKSDAPNVLRIEASGAGFRVTTNPDRSGSTTFTLTFDGKPSPVDGAAVISGTATSGRRVDDNTIEQAQSREGVATGTVRWTLSADGRTLSTRATTLGPDASKEPSITVFDRR